MEFCVLGSGSAGNCVLVRRGATTLLVDAGLSLRETRARASALGILLERVDGILLTHEHGDHVAHAASLSRGLDAPLFLNDGTRAAAERFWRGRVRFERIETGRTFALDGISVHPVPKPHDAADPVAYVLEAEGQRLGVFTDLGHADEPVRAAISGCRALVMESNHDPVLLLNGPYPPRLRARVGGRLGHISNADGAAAVESAAPDLGVLVLAHLSAKNNSARHVREAWVACTGTAPGYPRYISRQRRPTPLFDMAGRIVAAPAGQRISAAT